MISYININHVSSTYFLTALGLIFFSTDSKPFINSMFNYQLVNEGQPLALECSASGSPAPSLMWLLDGKELVRFFLPDCSW